MYQHCTIGPEVYMKSKESVRTGCTMFKKAVNDENTYFPLHFLLLDNDLNYFEHSHPDHNVIPSVLVNGKDKAFFPLMLT